MGRWGRGRDCLQAEVVSGDRSTQRTASRPPSAREAAAMWSVAADFLAAEQQGSHCRLSAHSQRPGAHIYPSCSQFVRI